MSNPGDIDDEVRHHEEDALEREFERSPQIRRGPEPGTFAFTARLLVEAGITDGDEADRWKDEMKEMDL
jgi:hypothetical protein